MSEPVVRVENVSKVFKPGGLFNRAPGFKAVSNVSLSVTRNRTLGIVGESGSGKSTLLRMVLRLLEPTEGRILVNGAEIWALRGPELKSMRRQLQPIFQN